MAWIQIHQQLKDHKKVLTAADELEIEPVHMMGLMVSFWLWAIDNAPSGSLAGISDKIIARAAQWDKDPEDFVQALISASLLDVCEDGTLEIHDWSEYTGKLIEQRENEKNRSKVRRTKSKVKTEQTEQPETKKDACEPQDEETPEDTVHTAPPAPTKEEQQTTQNQRFMEFWNAYPKKIGKKAAQSAWRKAKPDTALFSQIMQAVALAKTSDQWQREGGQFIPNPATWINQGRWDDELSQRVLCSQPITGNPFADALLESQTKGDEPF